MKRRGAASIAQNSCNLWKWGTSLCGRTRAWEEVRGGEIPWVLPYYPQSPTSASVFFNPWDGSLGKVAWRGWQLLCDKEQRKEEWERDLIANKPGISIWSVPLTCPLLICPILCVSVVLGIEPRAICMLEKCSTSELHPRPSCLFLKHPEMIT